MSDEMREKFDEKQLTLLAIGFPNLVDKIAEILGVDASTFSIACNTAQEKIDEAIVNFALLNITVTDIQIKRALSRDTSLLEIASKFYQTYKEAAQKDLDFLFFLAKYGKLDFSELENDILEQILLSGDELPRETQAEIFSVLLSRDMKYFGLIPREIYDLVIPKMELQKLGVADLERILKVEGLPEEIYVKVMVELIRRDSKYFEEVPRRLYIPILKEMSFDEIMSFPYLNRLSKDEFAELLEHFDISDLLKLPPSTADLVFSILEKKYGRNVWIELGKNLKKEYSKMISLILLNAPTSTARILAAKVLSLGEIEEPLNTVLKVLRDKQITLESIKEIYSQISTEIAPRLQKALFTKLFAMIPTKENLEAIAEINHNIAVNIAVEYGRFLWLPEKVQFGLAIVAPKLFFITPLIPERVKLLAASEIFEENLDAEEYIENFLNSKEEIPKTILYKILAKSIEQNRKYIKKGGDFTKIALIALTEHIKRDNWKNYEIVHYLTMNTDTNTEPIRRILSELKEGKNYGNIIQDVFEGESIGNLEIEKIEVNTAFLIPGAVFHVINNQSDNPISPNDIALFLNDLADYITENAFTYYKIIHGETEVDFQRVIDGIIHLASPALTSPNNDVRRITIKALGTLLKESGREYIIDKIKHLAKDPDPAVKIELVRSMGRIFMRNGNEKIIEMLSTVVEYGKDEEKIETLKAIGQIFMGSSNENAVNLVRPYLDDKNEKVRAEAGIAFINIYKGRKTGGTIRLITPLLNEENPRVKLAIVRALGDAFEEMNLDGLLKDLKKLVKDKDKMVRWAAAEAMGRIYKGTARKEVLDALAILLRDKDSILREVGVWAITNVYLNARHERVIEDIGGLLKDKEPLLKIGGAKVLGRLYWKTDDKDILTLLTTMVDEKELKVKEVISEAILMIKK